MAFLKSPPVCELHAALWNSVNIIKHTLCVSDSILLLFSISILPRRASGRELMWVKELTVEESPSSLQSPPLGRQKPFMFVYDLKGKYTPDAIYMCCRPAARKHHALEVENYVCLGRRPALITNTERLHFAVTLMFTEIWLFQTIIWESCWDDDRSSIIYLLDFSQMVLSTFFVVYAEKQLHKVKESQIAMWKMTPLTKYSLHLDSH